MGLELELEEGGGELKREGEEERSVRVFGELPVSLEVRRRCTRVERA